MATDSNGLTPKQEAFACAYVETGNASEAYRRVYQPKKMGQKAITVEAIRRRGHSLRAMLISTSRKPLATAAEQPPMARRAL